MEAKVLIINLSDKSYSEEKIDTAGALNIGVYYHFKNKSYLHNVFDEKNILVFGTGPLTGKYPGFSRGVVVFRSPLHGNIHASTGGDFGEYIRRAGYDAIVIEGKSENPCLVYINNDKVVFEEKEEIKSCFEIEKYMYKRYKEIFRPLRFRVVVASLAGKYSYFGSLATSKDESKIGVVPSIFGRGGAGSVMIQAHNLIGLAIGGSKDVKFSEEYKTLLKEIIEATKKYREKGTFYANYPHLKENTIMFNWKIFEIDKNKRLEYYKKFVEEILLRDYKFTSDTCGETCIAACKKIEGIKIDYEPAEGLGPFIGIFKRDLVKELIHLADSYGFDAIYLGQFLGFLMEALENEIVDPNIVEISGKPVINPKNYDKDYSDKNYEVAREIIEKIILGEIFAPNIRRFAETLNCKDVALYIPYGKENDMTPNYYWTLGLALPILMHGKYYSDYHTIFKEPEEYAKVCAQRTINEFILDNAGICRFHRGWVEPKFEKIFGKDFLEESLKWIKKLIEYRELTGIKPEFFDSQRPIEVYSKLIVEYGNNEWRKMAIDNPKRALESYWNIFEKEYYEILGQGVL